MTMNRPKKKNNPSHFSPSGFMPPERSGLAARTPAAMRSMAPMTKSLSFTDEIIISLR